MLSYAAYVVGFAFIIIDMLHESDDWEHVGLAIWAVGCVGQIKRMILTYAVGYKNA